MHRWIAGWMPRHGISLGELKIHYNIVYNVLNLLILWLTIDRS